LAPVFFQPFMQTFNNVNLSQASLNVSNTYFGSSHVGNNYATGGHWSRFGSGTLSSPSLSVTVDNFPNVVISYGAVGLGNVDINHSVSYYLKYNGSTISSGTQSVTREYSDTVSGIAVQYDVPVGTHSWRFDHNDTYNSNGRSRSYIGVAVIYLG